MGPNELMSKRSDKGRTTTATAFALTVRDAAIQTTLSESYLRVLIHRRELPVIRVGRAIRILVSDLEAFLVSRRRGGVDG